MDFDKYVKGGILSLVPCGTINIDELVSFLQSRPDITSLSLTGRNIGDRSITELSKLTNLASLTLSHDYISGKRAEELARFADRVSLALVYNGISDEGAEELAKLKNVKALIGNTFSDKGAKELAKLENAYADNTVSAEDAQKSVELKNIDTLTDNAANTESAKELDKPTSVGFNEYVGDNILSIQSCSTINISEVVNFLQSRPDITSLNLADCNIGDEGAKELAKLKNLTSLTLVGNNISSEGVKELAKLTNLTALDLSDNNISNEDAKELARLINLTYLDLSENDISSQVAKELSDKLVKLDYFDFSDNDVSNENEKKQPVGHATSEVITLSVSKNSHSNGIKKKGVTTAVDDRERNKVSPSTKHTPSGNYGPMPVLEQKDDTQSNDEQSSDPRNSSTQKNKLPIIIASTLAVAGVVSGIAIAVYLEMLVMGIAVGAVCCLAAFATLYCCNRPSNSLEDSNIKQLLENSQSQKN